MHLVIVVALAIWLVVVGTSVARFGARLRRRFW
jgi:hypothetical protein